MCKKNSQLTNQKLNSAFRKTPQSVDIGRVEGLYFFNLIWKENIKTLRSRAVAARSPHKAEVVSSNLTSRNQDSGTDFFGAVGDENPSNN